VPRAGAGFGAENPEAMGDLGLGERAPLDGLSAIPAENLGSLLEIVKIS
jgi:hypothetical protein